MKTRSSFAPRTHHVDRLVGSRYVVTAWPESTVLRKVASSCVRDAEHARAVLVDGEADHLRRLVPVEVDVARPRVGAHRRGDLARRCARISVLVLADHAELHREPDRRAVLEAVHAAAHLGEVARRRASSSRARTASRSSLLFVLRMNWPKFALTSCWSNGR